MRKKRILVGVLNWGIGHATRCIPLIHELLAADAEVVVASNGEALDLLKHEFPELGYVRLPSYQIRYPEKGSHFKWKILKQMLHVLRCVWKEHQLVKRLVREEHFDQLISDNRPGVWSRTVPSVYITHQVQVRSGSSTALSTWLHRQVIKRFDECWIPDEAPDKVPELNLSGALSRVPASFPVPVKYLGIRSRLKRRLLPMKYELLVLLSGPEPQRSRLESILLKELQQFEGRLLFVAGRPTPASVLADSDAHLQDFPDFRNPGSEYRLFLNSKELEKAMNQSKLVLCRSGFSSLLDLSVLGKKAFLIPTPGQYEQQYLAQAMKERGIASYCQQEEFTLEMLYQEQGFALRGTGKRGAR